MQKEIATPLPNHAEGVHIINFAGIVYHQPQGLHIIKPQVRCTPARDEIQGRLAALDDIRMYISPQASYTFNDMPSLRLG